MRLFDRRRGIRDLTADEGGQVSLLAVLGAAAFASLLLLVINSGHGISQKISLQNASDAVALSGTAWTARGLNVISLNNVTQTQLLAVAMIAPALDKTITTAIRIVKVELWAARLLARSPNPVTAAIGIALEITLTIELNYLRVLNAAVETVVMPMAEAPDGLLWDMMHLLGGLSGAVKASFPTVAQGEAVRIARENGAEVGMLVPAGGLAGLSLTPDMPVRQGSFQDLCDPTRRGSPEALRRGYHPLLGYEVGEGPLEEYGESISDIFALVDWNTGAKSMFRGFREASYRSFCSSTTQSVTHREAVDDLETCARRNGTAYWVINVYRTRELDRRQPDILRIQSDDWRIETTEAGDPGRPVARPCSRPPGTRVGTTDDRTYRTQSVSTRRIEGSDGQPARETYRYTVTEYVLVRAMVETTTSFSPPPVSRSDQRPFPYLLGRPGQSREAVRQRLDSLAVVYRRDRTPAGGRLFAGPFGRHRMAYAQARVYNATSFDLFTQDWRIKLVPASIVEDGLPEGSSFHPAVAAAIDVAEFGEALDWLRGGDVRRVMTFLNNH